MTAREHRQTVRQVLRDLRFPAQRWQILTCAQLYGAGAGIQNQLHGLPLREYRDSDEVAATLEQA